MCVDYNPLNDTSAPLIEKVKNETPRAAKDKRCDSCLNTIVAGNRYHKTTLKIDGQFSSINQCVYGCSGEYI